MVQAAPGTVVVVVAVTGTGLGGIVTPDGMIATSLASQMTPRAKSLLAYDISSAVKASKTGVQVVNIGSFM